MNLSWRKGLLLPKTKIIVYISLLSLRLCIKMILSFVVLGYLMETEACVDIGVLVEKSELVLEKIIVVVN